MAEAGRRPDVGWLGLRPRPLGRWRHGRWLGFGRSKLTGRCVERGTGCPRSKSLEWEEWLS